MRGFIIVGIGGFLGAIARYGVSLAVAKVWTHPFPLATFLVNIVGSLAIGLFAAIAGARWELDPMWRLFAATGFVGAFTTFSTFEYETNRLVEGGFGWWALANVVVSVVVGFGAVRLGEALVN
jgi:fluoride exporter